MTNTRTDWIIVDLDGLRKVLERRGKEFAIYELVQDAWDEDVTRVDVILTRPVNGRSMLKVTDDSPVGFRDLSDCFTMYKESYKKGNPEKRGAFNLGLKFVLALCDEATITSTKGQVVFSKAGRSRTKHRRDAGSEFVGYLRLTVAEYEQILEKAQYLISPIATTINGNYLPARHVLKQFSATLSTVIADEEGRMRPTKRKTQVQVFKPLLGETPTLYEMGIPVVETGDTWHINIGQKVPLNMERDNVTPAFALAVRVAVLNAMRDSLDADLAAEPWIRAAASHPECDDDTTRTLMDLRFGSKRVIHDANDKGSNREAASQDYTVIPRGSMTTGERKNAERAGAIKACRTVVPNQPRR